MNRKPLRRLLLPILGAFCVLSGGVHTAEPKDNFGGNSGGPEGEKAGALEFRKLRITAPE